jgi:hypothetical protein
LDQVVYILTVPSGYCKIGIATDAERRLRELQTGNHEKISLFGATMPSLDGNGVNAAAMESLIHKLLGAHRVQGEWFQVPEERLYMAWKQAWLQLARPKVIQRWKRVRFGEDVVKFQRAATSESNADHQAKWRKANAELNRQRARDGMRKKRAKGKS